MLFGDPLAGSSAGSPKWTFSDSFSVVRLSSVLDRGLTYVLQSFEKVSRYKVLSLFQHARFFSETEITIENSCFKVQASITARLEVSSGFRYYFLSILSTSSFLLFVVLTHFSTTEDCFEKGLRRSGD